MKDFSKYFELLSYDELEKYSGGLKENVGFLKRIITRKLISKLKKR